MKARVKNLKEIKEILQEVFGDDFLGKSKTTDTQSGVIYFRKEMATFCGCWIDVSVLKGKLYHCDNFRWHKDWLEIIDEGVREITKEEHEEIFRMFACSFAGLEHKKFWMNDSITIKLLCDALKCEE